MSEREVIHIENVYEAETWSAASLAGRVDLVRRLLVEFNDEIRMRGTEAPYAVALQCANRTLDEVIEILGTELPRPDPVPDLSPVEARAVVRGACRAMGDSDIAGLPPVGKGLGQLARALDRMHDEEGNDV